MMIDATISGTMIIFRAFRNIFPTKSSTGTTAPPTAPSASSTSPARTAKANAIRICQ